MGNRYTLQDKVLICVLVIIVHTGLVAFLFSPGQLFETGHWTKWLTVPSCFVMYFVFSKILNGKWFWWNV